MIKCLLGFFKGIFIGAGAILPGISSGVICVVLGIYEKIINSILNFFTNTKVNLKFLLPIIIGVVIGIVLFGNVLKYLYANYNTFAKICIAILILTSIPSIIKKAEIKQIKIQHILSLLLALSFSIYLVSLESFGNMHIISATSFASYLFAGVAMSAGVVIPGISSTIILMLLGKYEAYLSAVASLNFSILIPMGIGLCIGATILLFLIKFLLKNYKSITYFAIIGFVLGSLPILL